MDTEKLRQLADNLREQETVADEFRMQRWMDADNYNKIMNTINGEEPCGTAACICGEGLLQFNGVEESTLLTNLISTDIEKRFCDLFDVSSEEFGALAYQTEWPTSFQKRYNDADTDEERRHVAADRIEALINDHA